MALFGEFLGLEDEEMTVVKSLAADKSDSAVSGGVPVTVVSTEDNSQDSKKHVEFQKELNLAYRKEPQVFSSINLKKQMIMSAFTGELRTANDKDDKVLHFFRDFLDNLGNSSANDSTEEEILEAIFQNQMKYGGYHVETVYNLEGTKIVDLALTDATTMDFARNQRQAIVFDAQGSPVGFTQQLGIRFDPQRTGDPVPDEVFLEANQIFIRPNRIAYFWLYGDKLDPLGLIEPGLKSVIRKQNIEEAQTNSIYARGTYPIIDYVGSPERFPTPKMIKNATEKLAQMQHNRYFAFPYWHKIVPLEVKQSDLVDSTIKNLKEEIAASTSMPLAFSMGSGEATNRATLNNQQEMLEFSLNDVVKKTLSAFRKQIFKRISKLMNFKDNDGNLIVPFYVWGDVAAEDKDSKATRLTNYLKVGAITPEFVMPYVIKSEELVIDTSLKVPDKKKKEEKDKDKRDKKELSKSRGSRFSYSDVDEVLRRL